MLRQRTLKFAPCLTVWQQLVNGAIGMMFGVGFYYALAVIFGAYLLEYAHARARPLLTLRPQQLSEDACLGRVDVVNDSVSPRPGPWI